MYGSGLEQVFKGLIISLILAVLFGGWIIYDTIKDNFGEKRIESKTVIKPTYILTTDGKTVDTLYIYTFPRK